VQQRKRKNEHSSDSCLVKAKLVKSAIPSAGPRLFCHPNLCRWSLNRFSVPDDLFGAYCQQVMQPHILAGGGHTPLRPRPEGSISCPEQPTFRLPRRSYLPRAATFEVSIQIRSLTALAFPFEYVRA
jgi:hypothetical protein